MAFSKGGLGPCLGLVRVGGAPGAVLLPPRHRSCTGRKPCPCRGCRSLLRCGAGLSAADECPLYPALLLRRAAWAPQPYIRFSRRFLLLNLLLFVKLHAALAPEALNLPTQLLGWSLTELHGPVVVGALLAPPRSQMRGLTFALGLALVLSGFTSRRVIALLLLASGCCSLTSFG